MDAHFPHFRTSRTYICKGRRSPSTAAVQYRSISTPPGATRARSLTDGRRDRRTARACSTLGARPGALPIERHTLDRRPTRTVRAAVKRGAACIPAERGAAQASKK
jgi:hypothetical protein